MDLYGYIIGHLTFLFEIIGSLKWKQREWRKMAVMYSLVRIITLAIFNIIGYTNRIFQSVHEMNKVLTENWNAVVKPEDLVYHLGDFSFQSDKYRHYLNGHIILVRGNHDKKKYDGLFDEVVPLKELRVGRFNCILTHIPIERDRIYKKGIAPDFSLLDNHDYNLCGHVHDNWKTKGKNINVGVDVWDFKPIHIDELATFLETIKI